MLSAGRKGFAVAPDAANQLGGRRRGHVYFSGEVSQLKSISGGHRLEIRVQGVASEETRVRDIASERPPDAVFDVGKVLERLPSAPQKDGGLQHVRDMRRSVFRDGGPARLRESGLVNRKPGVGAVHVEHEKLAPRRSVDLDVATPERGLARADQGALAQDVGAVWFRRYHVQLRLKISFHRAPEYLPPRV